MNAPVVTPLAAEPTLKSFVTAQVQGSRRITRRALTAMSDVLEPSPPSVCSLTMTVPPAIGMPTFVPLTFPLGTPSTTRLTTSEPAELLAVVAPSPALLAMATIRSARTRPFRRFTFSIVARLWALVSVAPNAPLLMARRAPVETTSGTLMVGASVNTAPPAPGSTTCGAGATLVLPDSTVAPEAAPLTPSGVAVNALTPTPSSRPSVRGPNSHRTVLFNLTTVPIVLTLLLGGCVCPERHRRLRCRLPLYDTSNASTTMNGPAEDSLLVPVTSITSV